MPEYRQLLAHLDFSTPRIAVETCSKGSSWIQVDAKIVAGQFQGPVYFGDAIERIQEKHGHCIWIEAGSGTAAMPLVRRALQACPNEDLSRHLFHQVKLGGPQPIWSLAATTLALWDSGVSVQFWPFYWCQKHWYTPLTLPPYCFEKQSHWLEYIDRRGVVDASPATETPAVQPVPATMVSSVRYLDTAQQSAIFTINQTTPEFQKLI